MAVVLDGEGLSTDEMQHFARWTNLSETTFVLAPTAPEADYRVRIFTPVAELPFAGHPTLGTCHAWRAHASAAGAEFVQECEAGLVAVRQTDAGLAFAARHEDGRTAECRIAFCGVEPHPRRLPGLESLMSAGADPAAMLDGLNELDPMSSDDAPAAYRRHLAGVLLGRAASCVAVGRVAAGRMAVGRAGAA